MKIEMQSIGVIHTVYKELSDMPIQPMAANEPAYIELFPEYIEGLKDIGGFSHLTLLYHLHKVEGYDLRVVPFMDNEEHGIFATRSPKRPNAIGISTVRLIRVQGSRLYIEQADVLNGTPLLDIKPFFPRYDNRDNVSIGWLEKNKDLPVEALRSDDRFI